MESTNFCDLSYEADFWVFFNFFMTDSKIILYSVHQRCKPVTPNVYFDVFIKFLFAFIYFLCCFFVFLSTTDRDVTIFTIHFINPIRMFCASVMLMEVVKLPSISCHIVIFGVKTNNMGLFTLSTEIITTGVAAIPRGSRTKTTVCHADHRTSWSNIWHIEDTTSTKIV